MGLRERTPRLLLGQAADAGAPRALRWLAELREKAGSPQEAERLYRQAVDIGDRKALMMLARFRDKAGDQQEAERLVRFGLTAEGEIEAPWSP
ncbi:hypothetical protein [Streptosporangium sandarakinum]|uniref:hypothetical protein n=1 Tax=Streptosporangium sandarakinum TaxID=1260955 RepID=UPI0034395423